MSGCGESPCGEQSHCQGDCISGSHELKLQDGWALRSECVHLCEAHRSRFPRRGNVDHADNSNNKHQALAMFQVLCYIFYNSLVTVCAFTYISVII